MKGNSTLNICKMSLLAMSLGLIGCHANQGATQEKNDRKEHLSSDQNLTSFPNTDSSAENSIQTQKLDQSFQVNTVASLNEPWAMAILPDGRLLVTEKAGALKLFDPVSKKNLSVEGIPKVAYGGQGGLGDVALHPNFNNNAWLYLSYAEAGKSNQFGAVVIRAKLDLTQPNQPKLIEQKRIWEQVPKVEGQGHYAHRLIFDEQAKLWIAPGERQKFDPAQDMKSNLGKVLRLNDDGIPAQNNPFIQQGGVAAQIWSLGHRNPLGIAFDPKNQLWVAEMGPKGGDELNLITKAQNYGYPIVSNGDHYGGADIPDHATRPEYKSPEIDWTPVISPSSLIFYRGNSFPQWKNKALIGGLSSKAIIVVDTTLKPVQEVQRLDMGERIRDIVEAKDGSLWVLQDGQDAKLLKLTPP